MHLRYLTEDSILQWNRFAAASPDAWFWHTNEWMAYTREYTQGAFKKNLSFWVMEGSSNLAIVPAYLENWHGVPSLSYARGPLPSPAVQGGLSSVKKREVLEFAIEKLKGLAGEYGLSSFQLRISVLGRSMAGSNLPPANPFLRFGALDLPYQTQVIDLRRDLSTLWGEVRHGHQAAIRRGEKSLQTMVWEASNLTDEKFLQYQKIHAKDAGRVTRPQATFDLMKQWVFGGNAVLVEVVEGQNSVAFALILLFGQGAFYGSACKDPEKAYLPSAHLYQWRTIQWLKEHGFRFYELGLQQFGRQWFDNPSPKEVNISLFKRGFGGTTSPAFTGEFQLTLNGLREAIESRLRENLSETTPDPRVAS